MRAFSWSARRAFATLIAVMLPALAVAQPPPLKTQLVASGLTHPIDFVQDPGNPAVQYVVEQEGHIRVLAAGVVQAADFLNVSTMIASGGERGLLGLAFPPNYASSGWFFVYFTDPNGNLVVSRFTRSGNPLVATPGSRLDLLWSTNERFIRHPTFANHNGGHLAFGPDNFLYVSTGDGGSGGDPSNNAQNLNVLLGKVLRLDVVNVDAQNTKGFAVPSGNPFAGGARPEIWALGLRNPWKFSFDAATGALIIADVGQDAWEEVNYEPVGAGGRNYGWRNREGRHNFDQSVAATVLPLHEPIWEYNHTDGRSISGGFVYRGAGLGPSYTGRYFFSDFVTRRVWSIALNGESPAGDLREHTAELGGSDAFGNVSGFGVDSAGEIYLVSWSLGRIFRIVPPLPIAVIDAAAPSATGIDIVGWGIDRRSQSGSGIDAVHVYVYPSPGSGAQPILLGQLAPPFTSRPDVAAVYGAQFQQSGFQFHSSAWVPPGPALVVAFIRSTLTGLFEASGTRSVTIVPRRQRIGWVDLYPASSVTQPISIVGWTFDAGVATAPPQYGTGVSGVLIDVFTAGGSFVQTAPAIYGLSRPDVASSFGARFQGSGFYASFSDLLPGNYVTRFRYFMIAANDFDVVNGAPFTVTPGPMVRIETPADNSVVPPSFQTSGWAVDLRATSGPGVNAVHVYAYPNPGSGTAPIFLGAATTVSRPDVGAALGSQFTNSGYRLVNNPLPPGLYDIVVFARSTVTAAFSINRVVRVTVQ